MKESPKPAFHARMGGPAGQRRRKTNETTVRNAAFFSLNANAGALASLDVNREFNAPVLDWQLRSDWLSVKDLGAQGGGVEDDTAAIQAAYDQIATGEIKTVYFPPGRYRITRTLTITKQQGVHIVGHGRETVLVWDGADGGTMYWSNGAHRSTYEGLTYDGRGRAGIGSEHRSMNNYETHLVYRHCAFLNLANGIAMGKNGGLRASAEIWCQNVLFRNNGTEVLLNRYNDYDNWFDGCVFVDNETGLFSNCGHFNIRNCHFIRNSKVDIRVGFPQPGSSVRWCSSHGSGAFFTTDPRKGHMSMTIQECRVEKWTGAEGAISLALRGPTLIFDTVFVDPPDQEPPIRLINPSELQQAVVLANNHAPQSKELVAQGPNAKISEIPAAWRTSAMETAVPCFFRDKVTVPVKIFDAKVDFGAAGDGETDDTGAVQATIDAARGFGRGSLAYLPAGAYKITSPLRIYGNDYVFGGSHFRSAFLKWHGNLSGPVMEVFDPTKVAVENMSIMADSDGRN